MVWLAFCTAPGRRLATEPATFSAASSRSIAADRCLHHDESGQLTIHSPRRHSGSVRAACAGCLVATLPDFAPSNCTRSPFVCW